MCGIAGVAVDPGAVFSASDTDVVARLGHRGPDARGQRAFEQCVLGHTRLRIIDLSPLGDQPMANEDGTVWAVYNGEVYNFGELRSGLIAAGHAFRSTTDTEVLVHLYERDGDDMARRLRGMFAFAVWDERRRRLLLCRDRLGIKPLYYRLDGDRLAFASEVQALAGPGDALDAQSLAAFLRLGWVPGPRTIREGILELLPGHTLTWEAGRITERRYWSLPDAGPPGPVSAPDDDQLGAALDDAMARHLVADVPVGLFLSSGVDSVMVARLASRSAPGLRTYTVAFDGGTDESVEAATLARRLGLQHDVVPVGHAEALASVDRFVGDMDQPTVDGLNSWIISKAVRDAGLVVALSGLGGDELFCGYSTFRHVPRLVRAGRVARPFHAELAGADRALAGSSRSAHSRGRRALAGVAAGTWGAAYAAVRGLFSAAEITALWPPSNDLPGGAPLVHAPLDERQSATAVVGQLEATNYLPFQLLRDTDCMSMAHALEVRVPLLDDEVVALALAGQRAYGAEWSKRQLVASVDPSLGYLATRPKRTFTLPIDEWMRGRLRPLAEGAMVGLGEADLGFDRRELTELWCGYLAGRVGWRPTWALVALGRWLGGRHQAAPQHASRRHVVPAAVPPG